MQDWMKPILKRIEAIALSFEDVEQQYCSVHSSYCFENQVLFYLKSNDTKITLGCLKGYLMDDKFDFDCDGSAKYMRHIYIKNENDFSEEIIKSYIQEAIVCSIELNEKKKIKQHFRRK